MLGWLTAPLPDGTLQAVALGNFHGAKLSQSPPPKTALRANRITAVTITATNAVNETANCTNVHYWYPARGAVSKHTFYLLQYKYYSSHNWLFYYYKNVKYW